MPLPRKPVIGGAALAAVLAIATPAIQKYEGYSAVPYRDQIGKLTVCYGETNVKMHRYTKEECAAMLNGSATVYATAVANRNPSIVDHPYQWAAATALSYNIGIANYDRSGVAKNFEAGQWLEGCHAFKGWVYAGGHLNRGLVSRRTDEERLCLQQLPAAEPSQHKDDPKD